MSPLNTQETVPSLKAQKSLCFGNGFTNYTDNLEICQ